MNPPKINFAKILFGFFIFLAIFGLVQLLKDSGTAQDRALDQNFDTIPAESVWPEGWVKWSAVFEGEAVTKYGPEFSETDYVIVMPTRLIQSLPQGSSCVGTQETATCLVGQNAEVKAGFDKWSNI